MEYSADTTDPYQAYRRSTMVDGCHPFAFRSGERWLTAGHVPPAWQLWRPLSRTEQRRKGHVGATCSRSNCALRCSTRMIAWEDGSAAPCSTRQARLQAYLDDGLFIGAEL